MRIRLNSRQLFMSIFRAKVLDTEALEWWLKPIAIDDKFRSTDPCFWATIGVGFGAADQLHQEDSRKTTINREDDVRIDRRVFKTSLRNSKMSHPRRLHQACSRSLGSSRKSSMAEDVRRAEWGPQTLSLNKIASAVF